MLLVVDANVLIAELLRKRGRKLINSTQLEIYMAVQVKNEVEYELKKRIEKIVSQGRISKDAGEKQLDGAFDLINTKVRLVPKAFYSYLEIEAKKRISKDENDWEIVALALALPAAIWTEDYDFLGCSCNL